MNSLNPVRDLGCLSASGLLLYQAGHSALHLDPVFDQVEDDSEVWLCFVAMSDFLVEFASLGVQQRCDLFLEKSASLAMLLTRLAPSGLVR